jgi:hypothetical protein
MPLELPDSRTFFDLLELVRGNEAKERAGGAPAGRTRPQGGIVERIDERAGKFVELFAQLGQLRIAETILMAYQLSQLRQREHPRLSGAL